MNKIPLYVQKEHKSLAAWNRTIIRLLGDSGLFDVQDKDLPEVYSQKPGARQQNWNLIEVEGKTIGIDTWDTFHPTTRFYALGYFHKKGQIRPLDKKKMKNDGPLSGVDLLVKIQWYKNKTWSTISDTLGIPIKSWTVMPNALFPLESFKWQNGRHKYVTILTGKNNRFGRQPWVDYCVNHKGFFSFKNYLARFPMEEYIHKLKRTKWGLSLKGRQRNHDGKNRRECEYSSCGMPMALNYQPTYDFSFEAGKHYVLLSKPEDLEKLRDIDPMPYHEASMDVYEKYFSPVGMSKMLLNMVREL
tara:strand:- start:5116 stop:6021 length:906 start_codon:yes stop_codon:yes gene_type:complete